MSREKRKAKKEAEKRLSTRQFIGAKEITDYSLVTYGQGELVYFIVNQRIFLFCPNLVSGQESMLL